MTDSRKWPIKYLKTRNEFKQITAYTKQKKIIRKSTSGMHKRRLVHLRMALNPVQIYV